ncbi:hypothetical protein MMEU_1706 [Mycobacterium marinum str. Europe]|nr:hypothetical protein MMEU_1706 [Mycobacterium marinum str. Europe]
MTMVARDTAEAPEWDASAARDFLERKVSVCCVTVFITYHPRAHPAE